MTLPRRPGWAAGGPSAAASVARCSGLACPLTQSQPRFLLIPSKAPSSPAPGPQPVESSQRGNEMPGNGCVPCAVWSSGLWGFKRGKAVTPQSGSSFRFFSQLMFLKGVVGDGSALTPLGAGLASQLACYLWPLLVTGRDMGVGGCILLGWSVVCWSHGQ